MVQHWMWRSRGEPQCLPPSLCWIAHTRKFPAAEIIPDVCLARPTPLPSSINPSEAANEKLHRVKERTSTSAGSDAAAGFRVAPSIANRPLFVQRLRAVLLYLIQDSALLSIRLAKTVDPVAAETRLRGRSPRRRRQHCWTERGSDL